MPGLSKLPNDMTICRLAEESDVSRGATLRWLRGRPVRPRIARRIASVASNYGIERGCLAGDAS